MAYLELEISNLNNGMRGKVHHAAIVHCCPGVGSRDGQIHAGPEGDVGLDQWEALPKQV